MVRKWRRWVPAATLFLIVAVAASACSGSGSDTTGTSTQSTGTTSETSTGPGTATVTAPPDSTIGSTVAVSPDSTTTTVAVEVPAYSIESRTGGTGGDTVVILLQPGTYSDLDLETVVVDVVERFAPVATVHVVDDSSAVPLVLAESTTLVERELLAQHYFARLEEGFRLIFQGPFETAGQIILGS